MKVNRKHTFRWLRRAILWAIPLALFWLLASIIEWRLGTRLFPWSAYQFCGDQAPAALPTMAQVGFYEEFPVPWRLEKLKQVDFPFKLAVAAHSRAEFLKLRDEIQKTYPLAQEI